jgi:uncharacterized membrane protein YeiB
MAGTPAKSRIIGVDVARGIALAGMLAVHVFYTFNSDGSPSIATELASGRSAATFAVMAGVGLSLVTGGRYPLKGAARVAASAGLAVRGLLICLTGLMLGYATNAAGLDVYVILPYYAVMFLLAIPLLGLSPRVLAGIAVVLAVSAGTLLNVTIGDVANPSSGIDATLGTAGHHPVRLLIFLLFGGSYPAVLWLAYICAGMALGRLDLTSKRVAAWLLGGGVTLAATAWLTSSVLLFSLGGLQRIRQAAPAGTRWTNSLLLWQPYGDFNTWWWYAGRAPHTGTPLDMLHTLGVALAVLGAALLLTRLPLAVRLLRPLAAAGSMILTLYCAHILVLATGVLNGYLYAQYTVILIAMVAFAVIWRRTHTRGPLEALIAGASTRARRATANALAGYGRWPAESKTTAPPATSKEGHMNLQGEGPRQGHGDSVRGHRRPDERVRATEDRL